MDPAILRGLNDKIYDRRKAAAVELEKIALSSDMQRIAAIVEQLIGMFSVPTAPIHARNGGLIGLAAVAIALGTDFAPFLASSIPPLLSCFSEPENRMRYSACESLYNIAKVCKGEMLVYFNEIFDAMSKLCTDPEASVKNGSELLDRLIKDIVSDSATSYVSMYPHDPELLKETDDLPVGSPSKSIKMDPQGGDKSRADEDRPVPEDKRAFSLARFIPLLSERIYVLSPFTRMHLLSWLMVIDSVPDLELVAWLPEFLDGLLKYLADDNVDVRLATENLLADLLREIKFIANVREKQLEIDRSRREHDPHGESRPQPDFDHVDGDNDDALADDEDDTQSSSEPRQNGHLDLEGKLDSQGEGSGAWVPGQGVYVDHAAIMDIMIHHLAYDDELVQSTAMEWILTFLKFAQTTVVSFTPRIIPAILPKLASSLRHIKTAALETNGNLYRVIQSLPLQVLQSPPPSVPPSASTTTMVNAAPTAPPATSAPLNATSPPSTSGNLTQGAPGLGSRVPTSSGPIESSEPTSKPEQGESQPVNDPLEASAQPIPNKSQPPPLTITPSLSANNVSNLKIKPAPAVPASEPTTPAATEFPTSVKGSRLKDESHQATPTSHGPMSPLAETVGDDDPFDVRETVNVLTLQFLSDHAETRIAALEWLLMLHMKAPTKILSRDSGTFPALLKTLSDPSEDVVKHDLKLLAQISVSSEEFYFTSFMRNVLELFSTDRRLLENRGSLIIRQLCLHLNAEKIFRTIAEILEKDEDLEFASMMVVKLNMILITSPELSDFRRRLKNLDSKDGQMLFSSLYRSWCHNAVAVFALCLLAQAYEHASNLLQIFAELELTVSLLVQIDKLVMLIESPVFTNLRLQLLEPDKYPFLPKCLYGLLMILPQSSAFVSLRARLSVVNSSGYAPVHGKAPSTSTVANVAGAARAKLTNKDEIRWQELLSHFRLVQARHEKARRQMQSGEMNSVGVGSVQFSSPSQTFSSPPTAPLPSGSQIPKTATVRRKGMSSSGSGGPRLSSGLSALNPKRGGSVSGVGGGGTGPASGAGSGGGGGGMISAGVSIGGAVASMNSSQGLGVRPVSPSGGRRRLLGGMRKQGQTGS